MEEETEMEGVIRTFHTPQPETRIERVEVTETLWLIRGKWRKQSTSMTQEEQDRDQYLRSCKVN